jgi:8-oxo-dGTP pyrophosphatase MutT (NUDIX family)
MKSIQKHCAGAIIYDEAGRIFLMTSKKWSDGNVYLIPGGMIEEGETQEAALRREIREELGIELEDIVKVDESVKPASSDFYQSDVEFHFYSFFARAVSIDVKPNDEIKKYGWFTLEEAMQLPLLNSTRDLLVLYSNRMP